VRHVERVTKHRIPLIQSLIMWHSLQFRTWWKWSRDQKICCL